MNLSSLSSPDFHARIGYPLRSEEDVFQVHEYGSHSGDHGLRGRAGSTEKQHDEAPHLRVLQKTLAEEITVRVHSTEDLQAAMEASEILFGKGTTQTLMKLSEETLLSVFEGVPQCEITKDKIEASINVVDFLADLTQIFSSRGEARRMLKEGGVQVNKAKVDESFSIEHGNLLNNKYILVQKGKKNYFLVKML